MSKEIDEIKARLDAVEAHLAKIPAGTIRFVPAEPPTAWETVTAELTHKQKDALLAAGLKTVKSLRETAASEDGFTKLDGLGAAADAKLRAALEAL